MTPAAPPPEPLRHHLALALTPGLGPRLTKAVLDHFGSPAAVLRATPAELEAVPQVGAKLARKFTDGFRNVNVDREWDLIRRHGVTVAVRGDTDYPERLAAIDDPPGLLYFRGAITPADANAVGIVGSRGCTAYGRRVAGRMAAGLVRAGVTVVSGLARGIDGAAHRGALDAGGRTIAVLANGLSTVYPPEHADLAAQVAANGAVITETPMTMDPQPGMFPARNRIISALSRAVVVVEANERSGALITATHAAEQGRQVFAVPGNADSPASAGCLELIRKGAVMVRHADDILEDLRGIAPPDPPAKRARPAESPAPGLFDQPSPPPPAGPPGPPTGMDDTQKRIWDALAEPRHADQLTRDLGIPTAELTRLLLTMEMKKLIRRLAGNHYERR
jgi:DNA processing protein